uniref:Uncharacterized protein n=1 Tax=Leviviridae sp. TaxID=2027243 RepID=A0A514D6L9_9VIRU|nr:MAG: hypothetical protein H2RhizoLitter491419_000002 [Leviviridae sp.]
MALSDPQSITINSIAHSLPRIGQDISSGLFRENDGTVTETVRHSQTKNRLRSNLRFDHHKIVTDPLVTANNIDVGTSVSIVFDRPLVGYTVAELKQVVDGVVAYLAASSGAVITKILGNEA